MSDREIETLLGKYANTYQRGIDCESRGRGRAAFGCYQKIVEEIIDEMLAEVIEISSLSAGELKQHHVGLAQIEQTVGSRSKIALLKSILPTSLIPTNINPLAALHSNLSQGFNLRSDDECLKLAIEYRTILIDLVNEVVATRDAAKKTISMMRQLERMRKDANA
jgi:hypothetical protein